MNIAEKEQSFSKIKRQMLEQRVALPLPDIFNVESLPRWDGYFAKMFAEQMVYETERKVWETNPVLEVKYGDKINIRKIPLDEFYLDEAVKKPDIKLTIVNGVFE